MNIRTKLVNAFARMPTYSKEGDAGADLYCIKRTDIHPGLIEVMPTGVCFEIPAGYEGQVRGRSGLSAKGLWVATGTVDAGYRGEVKVVVRNLSGMTHTFAAGDRIAQIIFAPVARATFEEVEELDDTDRGAGGFGSTGV